MKAGTVGYAAPATHAELGVMHPLVREWFFRDLWIFLLHSWRGLCRFMEERIF